MKILLNSLLGLLVLTFAATLYAANPDDEGGLTTGHLYLSLQAGAGGMDTGDYNGILGSSNVNQKIGGFTYRLAAGYLINLTNEFKIGPEIGYMKYPDNTYNTKDGIGSGIYSGNTVDLLANAQFYFTDHLYGIGKLGVGYVTQKLNQSAFDENTGSKTNTTYLPEAALGLGFNLTQTMGFSLTYNTLFNGANNPASETKLDNAASVASVTTVLAGFHLIF